MEQLQKKNNLELYSVVWYLLYIHELNKILHFLTFITADGCSVIVLPRFVFYELSLIS